MCIQFLTIRQQKRNLAFSFVSLTKLVDTQACFICELMAVSSCVTYCPGLSAPFVSIFVFCSIVCSSLEIAHHRNPSLVRTKINSFIMNDKINKFKVKGVKMLPHALFLTQSFLIVKTISYAFKVLEILNFVLSTLLYIQMTVPNSSFSDFASNVSSSLSFTIATSLH